MTPKYQRILLKLSGEALRGEPPVGDATLSADVLTEVANEIKEVNTLGVQLALVVGGGNIIRGLKASQVGIDRATGDYMGMLATVINCLGLQASLESLGVSTRTMSALGVNEVAEPYIRRRAIRHLEKNRVVLLAAGTGNPYFTTDTAAALRAMELKADVLLKATKVDGIYDTDPFVDPDARRLLKLTYMEVLKRDLKFMDTTAVSLCMDNKIPIMVFRMAERGNLRKAILGQAVGSIVENH